MAMILPARDYCFWYTDLVPDGSECLTTIHGRVVAIPGHEVQPAPWRRPDDTAHAAAAISPAAPAAADHSRAEPPTPKRAA